MISTSKIHTSVRYQTVGLLSALIKHSVHHALQYEELNPENNNNNNNNNTNNNNNNNNNIIKQIH